MIKKINYNHSLIFFISCIFLSSFDYLRSNSFILICFFLILILGVSHGALDNIKGRKLIKILNEVRKLKGEIDSSTDPNAEVLLEDLEGNISSTIKQIEKKELSPGDSEIKHNFLVSLFNDVKSMFKTKEGFQNKKEDKDEEPDKDTDWEKTRMKSKRDSRTKTRTKMNTTRRMKTG